MRASTGARITALMFAVTVIVCVIQDKPVHMLVSVCVGSMFMATSFVCEAIERKVS